jgi:hypothetical protein
VASDKPFEFTSVCPVDAPYYKNFILPSLTPEKIVAANRQSFSDEAGTKGLSSLLIFSIKRYLDKFEVSSVLLIFAAVILLTVYSAFFHAFSSGSLCGFNGICCRSVFNRVDASLPVSLRDALLQITSADDSHDRRFVLGSLFRRFPFSDFAAGIYACLSLLLLTKICYPPLGLFCYSML